MTIAERHQKVEEMTATFLVLHEKYFPPKRSLTDEEWEKLIEEMNAIAAKYKGQKLEDLAGELCMCFLNDIERIHKAWRKKESGI